MGILNDLYYYIEETRDPRTVSWPFMSLYSLFTIYFCYCYFIFVCGPRYMKNRPPYSLKTIIKCYNIFQIFANIMLVKAFSEIEWVKEAISICSPITYSTDPLTMKMVEAIWWTLLLKIFDLIETGIFVLRKKDRQVSFLHVYHHISTILLVWLAVRYMPSGMATVTISINCGIHVIMYTYYLLSSLNSYIQRIITPYKPILTLLQMVQLFVVSIYMGAAYMPSCVFPKFLTFVGTFTIITNLLLFFNFYNTTYTSKKTKK